MLHSSLPLTAILGLSYFLPVSPAPQQTVDPGGVLGGVVGQPCATSLRDTGASMSCLRASSVPELGKLFPLSNDFFIEAGTGKVGVGTIFPSTKLHVIDFPAAPITTAFRVDTDSTGGTAIYAQNQGTGSAIRGLCKSGYGAGVAGSADDGIGSGYFLGAGVSGTTGLVSPPFGPTAGVSGWARNPAGVDSGVFGITDSDTDGAGVLGVHDSAKGLGAGVEGQTESTDPNAAGVIGAVLSTIPGNFSAGVVGTNAGTAGSGIGVWGSQAGSGWGVYGSVSGAGYGVLGDAPSGGIGVLGSGAAFGVFSSGDFGGSGAKYFVQPHPEEAQKEIRFVCLEGNESGTYFRGSASLSAGERWLDVPEEFRLTTSPDGITVQVTPRANARLWVAEVGLDGVLVRGDADVDFDYFVNGVRRGFGDHESIQDNVCFVPVWRDVPFGSELRPEVRRMLVENGTLNADFTPNETTAARMGWELRDPSERSSGAATEVQRRASRAVPRPVAD